jgi:biopolymer transport protein ExbB
MSNKLVSLIMLFLLAAATQASAAWWHDDWKFYKELQVDVSGLGEAGEADRLPVLIKLSGGNFPYFTDVLPKGEDLRFVAADHQTVLKHHVEKFDPLTEIALVWVQVPRSGQAKTVGPVTTETVYMYYNNPAAVAAEDAAGTYDVNQALVYHFDTPAGPRDVTAYENHPAEYSGMPDDKGFINGAARFTPDSILGLPASTSLQYQAAQGYGISVWIRLDDVQVDARVLTLTGPTSLAVGVAGGALVARLSAQDGATAEERGKGVLQNGVWHHLGISIGSGETQVYLDGAIAATLPGVAGDMLPNVSFGSSPDQAGFNGVIDELQVSSVARGRAWFAKAHENQAVGSDIVVFGEDQTAESSGGESYMISILGSVSIDGWVIIFLLGIMAAAGLVVAVGKTLMLSRVKKDNVKFLAAFKQLSTELTGLDREESKDEQAMRDSPFLSAMFGSHDHYQSSNLYHLYHIGIKELNARVGSSRTGSLSPQNIAAARAALDAAFVREQQRLNKSMVVLTIAISGGPFLGLLGTVLGVMITFAAIAISGDVNINAIAPGVSAALMTTVAGLAVAIPALFTYNYLSTRIRDMTIDMRVFVDELVARIAEYHS